MIEVIVCMDSEGGIGKDGGLPWLHEFSDLWWFKACTESGPANTNVIMGRKTWESLPKRPLDTSRRSFMIVTRDREWMCPIVEDNGSTHLITHLDEAIELALESQERNPDERIVIAGGGEIYAQVLDHPLVTDVWVTQIASSYDCDTFFELPDGFRRSCSIGHGLNPSDVQATLHLYTRIEKQ